MDVEEYPDCIKELPKAKIPMQGVQARIAQGVAFQIAFFEIEPIGTVPPHSHNAQYGFVIEGEMLLTIGDKTNLYKRGDSYYIPEGVVHSAEFKTFCKIMDFFAEPARYETE
ncbi:cupin domain-containing protein [Candidatus Thorarchaeota archaeon]|nr:MAG: cupin domain-containing protein [Candidatus Thorarchaeota archaeon]